MTALAALANTPSAWATIVIDEPFSYPNGPLNGSDPAIGGVWANHSGTLNQMQVVGGEAVVIQTTQSEDLNLGFEGGVVAGAGSVYYAGFDLRVSATNVITVYFAHFIVPPTTFTTRVFLTTFGGSDFTLGISDTSSLAAGQTWASGLTFGTVYRVVISYNFDTRTSRLWVNPAMETDTSIQAVGTTSVAISGFALREASSSGTSTQFIDNLIVATTFTEALGTPAPTGACCVASVCSITTQAGCAGTWQGAFTTCTPDPCPMGACCVGASCSVTSPAACTASGGAYLGNNTSCPTCSGATLATNVTGSGSIALDPSDSCNCYPINTLVTVTATAGAGWIFDHWEGDLTGTANPESITMNANKTITAVFLPLYRVRVFATGNGTGVITAPAPDGFQGSDPLFRQGTVVSLNATAGTIGTPASTWTFNEWHDANLVQVSATPMFDTPPLMANQDYTARFLETPLNASAQQFTAGNIVVGAIRDFAFDSTIELREYDALGRLVQPPVLLPTTGTPSGQAESPLATTIFQIEFDLADPCYLYTAANGLNDASPEWSGWIRSRFTGGAHTADLATGQQSTQDGRGVAPNGNTVFYSNANGIRWTDVSSPATFHNVANGNPRMLGFFGGALYCTTASGTAPFTSGPGLYRIDDPTGTPVFTQIIATGASSNPLEFEFANADTVYIAFQQTSTPPRSNVHKYTYDSGSMTWLDHSFNATLGSEWGRGLDVVVSGINATVYVHTTSATSEGRVVRLDDTLDGMTNWEFITPVDLVPRVSRGRSLAVVPSGCVVGPAPCCAGDMDGSANVDFNDTPAFVSTLLSTPAGTCPNPAATADVNGDTFTDGRDIGPFVAKVLANAGAGTPCP